MEFPQRLLELRKNLGHTQEEMGSRLGVSGNWISLLERGHKEPGDSLLRHVELLEQAKDTGLLARSAEGSLGQSDPTMNRGATSEQKLIPVIGWAHAGNASSYEELPHDWREFVPSNCRDPKAFAVVLEGDSMEPRFGEGDVLELMPSEEIHNGCLAVIRLVNDGVIFRRVQISKGRLRLIPLNERYEVEDFSPDEISWAYPVWRRSTQLWKR